MTVRTATLGRRKFRVNLGPLAGLTTYRGNEVNEIFVRTSDMTEYQILKALLHEADHAQHPHKSETAVDKDSREIARLLWRLGYRKK